jgi:hypothetical protein
MSEFTLHCEQFIAVTRQHLFSAEPAAGGSQDPRQEDPASLVGCRAEHRCHTG